MSVSEDALQIAREARAKIDTHEEVCAERYANINASLAQLMSLIKYAGSTLLAVLLSVLAWLIVAQLDSWNNQRHALEDQVRALQQNRPQPPPL